MEIAGYKIKREIGSGGMATVYLAVQESLKRSVVLKVLNPKSKGGGSKEVAQRFIDEGQIIASLHHPNIVTIFDIGLSGNEMYISMEYVQGGDLKTRLKKHMGPKTALNIIRKICSALASAHSRNIIHRDVKPANILFRDKNTPLLTDFGVAKQTDSDNELTLAGGFLGSPNYVSPEQASGEKVDSRTDIYSLGCVFYEILTQKKPYTADSFIGIIMQHKTAPVPTLPKKLSIYQPLLNKMMAKNRNDRFSNATELLTSIAKFKNIDKYSNVSLNTANITATKDDLKTPRRKSTLILISLLILSATFFFGLQFVDITLKNSPVEIDQIQKNDILPATITSTNLAEKTIQSIAKSAQAATTEDDQPAVSDEVRRALIWLGENSLNEYRLIYPPQNNAYYYFSRLLELEPDNSLAYKGILSIAERYATLARRALINNKIEKAKTYIDSGLKVDHQNDELIKLKSLVYH